MTVQKDGDVAISIFNDDDESQTFHRDEKELPDKENDDNNNSDEELRKRTKMTLMTITVMDTLTLMMIMKASHSFKMM